MISRPSTTMYGASGEEGPSGAIPGGGTPHSAASPLGMQTGSPAQVPPVPPGVQPQMLSGVPPMTHATPLTVPSIPGLQRVPGQTGVVPPATGAPVGAPFGQPSQTPLMMGGAMYPMVNTPADGAQLRPGMVMMPGIGSYSPNIIGAAPMPGSGADTKTSVSAPAVHAQTQIRPPQRPETRRGRPPRHAKRNPGQIMYAGSPPVATATESVRPVAPEPKQFVPSLSVPQQQALLARAVQMAKQQDSPTYTPGHALLQMGLVFVRGTQAPQVANALLGGDGTILRIEEATSLGLFSQRPGAPSITPNSVLPSVSPNISTTIGAQAEGILPTKSAVNMPVTPMNTRVSRVPTEPKLSGTDEKDLRHVLELDAAYSRIHSKQQQRADTELRTRAAPTPTPWFVKPAVEAPTRAPFNIVFPSQHRDAQKNRVALGKAALGVSERQMVLVPIRLDIEHEPYKLRDTFTWNAAEDQKTLDAFANTLCDDFGLPHGVFIELIRDAVHSQVAEFVSAQALFPCVHDSGRGHLAGEELTKWHEVRTEALHSAQVTSGALVPTGDMEEPDMDPEVDPDADPDEPNVDLRIVIKLDICAGGLHLVDQFEWDVLAGPDAAESFATAFATDLGLAGEFTTAIAHSIREQVSTHVRSLFLLGYPLNAFEMLDEEFRSAFLPHVEPENVTRRPRDIVAFTPRLQQLASTDVIRLERERERDMRRKRRQTKSRRVIGLPDREPQSTFRTPPVWGLQGAGDIISTRRGTAAEEGRKTTAKRVRTDWYDFHFVFPGGLGLPRSIPRSTPRYRVSLSGPQCGALGTAAPTFAVDAPAAPRGRPPKSRQPVNAWDAALGKGVRREDLERQHPNIHEGHWYCGNCGCPDILAPGRRKGPLGEKSLCGPCGKYFHQHRRMEAVEYTRDPEVHKERLKRLGFPVNEVGATTVMPHEHEHGRTYMPFDDSDSEISDNPSSDEGRDTPGPPAPIIPTLSAAEPRPTHPDLPSVGRAPPPTPSSPQWLQRALSLCRAKYPADRFWEIARPAEDGSGAIEWRIRCADCPGKLYKLGPGDSLSNFEIHLKNRSHRAAVAARLGAAQ